MMAQEIVTAVSENIKLVIVIVQNHGFASIGELSEKLGSQRFGTYYRYRNAETGLLNGDKLPIDLAANAESLGADVIRVKTIDEFRAALEQARAATRTTAIHIETDPLAPVPSSQSWWDVPVSQVAQRESTKQARKTYEAHKAEEAFGREARLLREVGAKYLVHLPTQYTDMHTGEATEGADLDQDDWTN